MDFPTEVRRWLEAEIADIASRPEECAVRPGADFTRTRKIGLAPLIWMLVTMGAGSLSHELMGACGYDPARMPTKSAFCQQRSKLLPSALRLLLRAFASHLGLTEYRDGWALVAADGSTFGFGPDRSDEATYHANRDGYRGRNEVHAVALCDMVSGHYVDAVIQNGREKDEFAALCELADGFPAWAKAGLRPIVVADRGFASYNVFAHLAEAGLHFAIRAKDSNVARMLGLGGPGELPDEADCRVRLVLTRSGASRPEAAGDYRRVRGAFDFLSDERPEYAMDLRIVRFPIGGGQFENVVTNLPEDEFGADEIREVYGMRWSIETSFRRLKHDIGASEVHSRRAALVMQEIFARMVLYDFCVAVAAHASEGREASASGRGAAHPRRTNFADACRACCAFLRGKARAPDVERLVAGSTSPVRPGRLFSRSRRPRTPSGYAYRPA